MTLQKLNIQPKVDNAAKKKMVQSNTIGANETLMANEVNALVAKTNELVDATNNFTAITGFNFKENKSTYADLASIVDPQKDDAYGVLTDGLIYIYNGTSWPTEGNGLDLKLRPTGTVAEGVQEAVSGGEVFSNLPDLSAYATQAAVRDIVDLGTFTYFPENYTNGDFSGLNGSSTFSNRDFYFVDGFHRIVFYKVANNVTQVSFFKISSGDPNACEVIYFKSVAASGAGVKKFSMEDFPDFDFEANSGEKIYVAFGNVEYKTQGVNDGAIVLSSGAIGSRTITNTPLQPRAWVEQFLPLGGTLSESIATALSSSLAAQQAAEDVATIGRPVASPRDFTDVSFFGLNGNSFFSNVDFFFTGSFLRIVFYKISGNQRVIFVRADGTVVFSKTFAALPVGRNELTMSDFPDFVFSNYESIKLHIAISNLDYTNNPAVNAGALVLNEWSGVVGTNGSLNNTPYQIKAWVETVFYPDIPLSETVMSLRAKDENLEVQIAAISGGKPIARKPLVWNSTGDSITWLNDNITNQPIEKGYQTILKERYLIATHNNFAANGATSQVLSSQLASWTTGDIWSVCIGTNDWWNNLPLGTILDFKNATSGNTFYGNLRKIINRVYALNSNAILFLITPIHRTGCVDTSTFDQAGDKDHNLIDYVNAVREISELAELPLIDLWDVINKYNLSQLTYDGTHPNSDGYKRIAHRIAGYFERYIEEIY